jgi:HK97 family phage portal protein
MAKPMSLIRSLLERRSWPPAPDEDFWYQNAGYGSSTFAGIPVTEDTALRSATVFACIRLLSSTGGSLPLQVFRRLPDAGKELATDHPNYPLLHDGPNPETTSFEWNEQIWSDLESWGNHYSNLVLDGRGTVKEIWRLRPDRMRVERDPANGERIYRYQQQTGITTTFTEYYILHIPGLGFDGLVGYSPIAMAMRQPIALELATERMGSNFFSRGARPDIILEHPGRLSDPAQERLRESWHKKHGASQLGVAVIEEGMKVKEVGIPPEHAQFLETRKFQRSAIAGMFNIPAHMINDLEKATFSNVEHLDIFFAKHTIRPRANRIEKRITKALFGSRERGTLFAEYNLDALMRGDAASRAAFYTSMVTGSGAMTRNEVRAKENLNPLPGLDAPLMPLNMVPVGAAPPPQTPPTVRSDEPLVIDWQELQAAGNGRNH